MILHATEVYPSGLATFEHEGRAVTVTDLRLQETYGGVIEGAPTPKYDAINRDHFLRSLRQSWGERATFCVPDDVVEIGYDGGVIRRMPAVTCAAWLTSDPIDRRRGAASELVLVFRVETLDAPLGELVRRALAGVDWEVAAHDFDY